MLKLYRVTKVKVFFLVWVYDFNFNLFEFSAAILEKGLLGNIGYPSVLAREIFSRDAFRPIARERKYFMNYNGSYTILA